VRPTSHPILAWRGGTLTPLPPAGEKAGRAAARLGPDWVTQ